MYSRAYVEITNICNMHCSFCHGHHRAPGQMSPQTFLRVLEQLSGVTRYIYYHLMGEPLIHPQLPEFLQLARERDFYSVITTNGTLLKKRGAELLAAGLHKVNISIHSFEEDDPKRNTAYLEEVAAFAREASEVGTIVSFRLWNRGLDEGRNALAEAVLRRCLEGEWTPNSRGYRIRDRVFLEYGDRFQWPDTQAPVRANRVYCHGLLDQFGVLCDGSVVPCCLDSEGTVTLGNLLEKPLREILNSPRAKAMAEGFRCRRATEELCRRCGYAARFD